MIKSEELKLKKIIRARDGNCCVDCGMPNDEHIVYFDRSLDVHRLERKADYTLSGCVTLCWCCHQHRHGAVSFAVDHVCDAILPYRVDGRRKGFVIYPVRITKKLFDLLEELTARSNQLCSRKLNRNRLLERMIRLADRDENILKILCK